MKGIPVILALLAMGMLVFGCTYSSQNSVNYSAGNSDNTTGTAASGGAQSPAGGNAGGTTAPSGTSSGGNNPPAVGGNASGAATPGEAQPGSSSAQDLSGKNYSGLIGLGSPSQCTVTYTLESGSPVTLNLYFNGNNMMRIEQNTSYSDCPKALMIYKGNSSGDGMLYLSCPGHEEEALGQDFMTDKVCQWQSMEIEEKWGGIGSSSLGIGNGYTTPNLEYLPSPVYSCKAWTLDASKFDTSGFVCD